MVEVNGGGRGVEVQPGAQGAIFTELQVVTTLVSDAFAEPATAPTVDTLLWQYDAAGNVGQWLYVVPLAAWKGVQVG